MPTRTFAVVAAGAGATVLAATGITYALTTGSAPASPAAHRAAKPVHRVVQPAHRAARPVQRAAPAAVPSDGGSGGGGRNEGRHGGGRGYGHRDGGRIYFNERTYSASEEGCITAASGPGANSFSVVNDSWKVVEVFRGFNCDNGAPVATVGPHGRTFGVVPRTDHGDAFDPDGAFGFGGALGLGGLFGDDGVVGSFQVIDYHDAW
ncbi:hypothetical protein AB0L59_01590 [Streptomyces sp. NPDC052109]|uniref:hypothetical protein n=1 Tax=Streptomyces sp. NPDC052109 TaxID=3155527 RepID=UPI00343D2536